MIRSKNSKIGSYDELLINITVLEIAEKAEK
jgi:hypothetical protein